MKKIVVLFIFTLILLFGCSVSMDQSPAEFDSIGIEDQQDIEVDTPTQTETAYFTSTQQVIDYVESKLGAGMWEWNTSSANLVIIRGAGAGYKPSSSEHAYDDLYIVAYSNGTIYQYTYGNSEGTTNTYYVSKYGYNIYKDPVENTYCTPALAPGRYKFKVGTHPSSGGYKALNVYHYSTNSRYNLPTQRRSGKYGNYLVSGVNIHKGGNSWNYSVGCLTLHYSQYDNFIAKYTTGTWGRVYLIGNYNSTDNIAEPVDYPEPFTRTLKVTSPLMRGDDVKLIQLMYNDLVTSLGYSSFTISTDGYYGNDCKTAIANVQNYYGLSSADGIAGAETLTLLVEKFINIGNYYSPFYRLLKNTSPLMYGDDIKTYQQLYNVWAADHGKSLITADGWFGSQCYTATINFQQSESSLPGAADGLAGKKTSRLLWVRTY